MPAAAAAFASLLRQWRGARRLSQEALAFEAQISTRHLSYLETGKANPSREMVLGLAIALDLELRDRNVLLTNAGFAPLYPVSELNSLALAPIRDAVELILSKQEPYPAVLIDRCWNVLRTNRAALHLVGTFAPGPPEPEIVQNVVRSVLHPRGLRSALVNWEELAALTVDRLTHECQLAPQDEDRQALLAEVLQYPGVNELPRPAIVRAPTAEVHLRVGHHEVRFFTMLTTIGTPFDVTAQDLGIESYFPMDGATEAWCRTAGTEGVTVPGNASVKAS